MRAALTPPFAAAALVLCIAAGAKLRSPEGAARALVALGARRRTARLGVRALTLSELSVGAACILAPSAIGAALLAALYAAFALAAAKLARLRASCGCFGTDEAPASSVQSLLSAACAAVGVASAVAGAHGAGWLLDRGAGSAAVLVVGIVGCAYALVVAYTDLPTAWAAWSAR